MPSNMPAAVPISASVRHLSEPSLGSNGRPACSVSIQDQHAGARQQWTRGHANRKRQPLAAYRFGGLECMLLGPGEGGLMSMIG
jgi:hypothetical protein